MPRSVAPNSEQLCANGATWRAHAASASLSAKKHPMDELLSAVRKAVRHGDHRLLVYCIVEIWTSYWHARDTAPLTSLVHRLVAAAGEDVLFTEVGRVGRIAELETRAKDNRARLAPLLEMGALLLGARRSRLVADYRGFFEGGEAALAPLEERHAAWFVDTHTHPKAAGWLELLGSLAPEAARHEEAVARLCFALQAAKTEDGPSRARRGVCAYNGGARSVCFAWEILGRAAGHYEQHLRALYELWKPQREGGAAFLVQAVLLVVHGREVPAPTVTLPEVTEDEAKALAKDHMESEALDFAAPEFEHVLDSRTARGRREGRGPDDELAEEDLRFVNAAYRAAALGRRRRRAPPETPRKRRAEPETPQAPRKAPRKAPETPRAATPRAAAAALARPGTSVTRSVVFATAEPFRFRALVGARPVFLGAGGNKQAGVRVELEGRARALRVVAETTHWGMACFVLDELKAALGLRRANPRLMQAKRRVVRRDPDVREFEDNYRVEARPTVYLATDHLGDAALQSLPQWHLDAELLLGYFKVVVMRAVFGCSDTHAGNAVVDAAGEVHSVDEARILEGPALRRVLGKTNRETRRAWRAALQEAAGESMLAADEQAARAALRQRYRDVLGGATALPIDGLVAMLDARGYAGEANREFLQARVPRLASLVMAEIGA